MTRQMVVVTFCNHWQRPARIGFVDVSTLHFMSIRLHAFGDCPGMTGLQVSGGLIYAIALSPVDMRKSSLMVVDARSLDVVAATPLESVHDAHSLLVCDDRRAYVVSTGTDEVVELELDGPHVVRETVVWRPPGAGPREDHHHVNSILEHDGRLVASGFGPKKAELWTSARNGFIWDMTRGEAIAEDIYHPHSVTDVDGMLAWCASASRTVEFLDGRRSGVLDGYVRGLCWTGDAIFVGTSKGRFISKSEGTFAALGREGGEAGACRVVRLDPRTLEVSAATDVSAAFNEIFELAPLVRIIE